MTRPKVRIEGDGVFEPDSAQPVRYPSRVTVYSNRLQSTNCTNARVEHNVEARLRELVGFGKNSHEMVKLGKTLLDLVRFGENWYGLVKFRTIWQDLAGIDLAELAILRSLALE